MFALILLIFAGEGGNTPSMSCRERAKPQKPFGAKGLGGSRGKFSGAHSGSRYLENENPTSSGEGKDSSSCQQEGESVTRSRELPQVTTGATDREIRGAGT